MANDLIFNPLLKKGFQYSDDGGDVEAEIEDLRQHKITKCLISADLNKIVENEIFQWQGENTIIQNFNFVNGYFYKKTLITETIIAPVTQLRVFVEATTDFNYNGIQYSAGDYYCKSANYNNLSKTYKYIGPSTVVNDFVCTVIEDNGDWLAPGTIFKRIKDGICTNEILSNGINHGSGYIELFFQDGSSFVYNSYTSTTLNIYFASYNQTGFVFNFATYSNNPNVGYICAMLDAQNNIIDWVPLHCFKSTIYQNVTIKEETFSQTNTQPTTPGITAENGTLKVSFPVLFEDDVTVKGTQTVVHTEEIKSENDYIELRADNPLGLANGERSGLEVNNYDGNGTDCVLAVDKQGWARVGDSSGTLQKLATIEENPTDGGFATYNETDKELQTTTDGSNLNVNFTGTFKITQNIFSGNSLADMFRIIHGGLFTCQYTADNIYNTIKSLIANSIRVGCISAQETTQAYLPAGNDEAYCVLFFKTEIGNIVPLLAIGYVVNKVFISHFNITQSYTSFTWVQI